MTGRLWENTSAALQAICASRAANEIDVHFLNDHSIFKNITTTQEIDEIFKTVRPIGSTPTGRRLDEILRTYLEHYKKSPGTTKPIKVIVITDGEPSSDDDVESAILMAAKTLDEIKAFPWQIIIHFFQVGNEIGVKEHFIRLHNKLQEEGLREIVTIHPSLHNLTYLFNELGAGVKE
jgi:uncharacterized protein YegL